MKRILVACLLALVVIWAMVMPVSAAHSKITWFGYQWGTIDVDNNGAIYYYESAYSYQPYTFKGINDIGVIEGVSFYTTPPRQNGSFATDRVGTQEYTFPNLQVPYGWLNNNFHPVENPSYIFPFTLPN